MQRFGKRCEQLDIPHAETEAQGVPADSILEDIETSDLVVAGIHSRKFLKDIFVGSLTRQLIDYGHTPLLLS